MESWRIKNAEYSFICEIPRTHLIMAGVIHLCQPSSLGMARSVFPGSRINIDNQISPRTFAKEVVISAKTMSEK